MRNSQAWTRIDYGRAGSSNGLRRSSARDSRIDNVRPAIGHSNFGPCVICAPLNSQKTDYPHALEDYNEAIELAPFAQAFANRAVVLERMGRIDDADHDRERAGFYHLLKGECDKALPDYELALAHNSKIAAALYGRGLCKTRSGDNTTGSADLSVARAIDANSDAKYDWPK